MKALASVSVIAGVLLAMPATARAEWIFFPFAAVNAGGDTTSENAAYGGSVGWNRGWLGAEVEFAWSPEFFDSDGGFRTRHMGTTFTGTAILGPRIGSWRPYGALGIGVLRSEIEEVGGLASLTDNRAALHVGGGAMWLGAGRIGWRGDVRYIRALDDTEPEPNVFGERLGEFKFWRVGGGVVIRW